MSRKRQSGGAGVEVKRDYWKMRERKSAIPALTLMHTRLSEFTFARVMYAEAVEVSSVRPASFI